MFYCASPMVQKVPRLSYGYCFRWRKSRSRRNEHCNKSPRQKPRRRVDVSHLGLHAMGSLHPCIILYPTTQGFSERQLETPMASQQVLEKVYSLMLVSGIASRSRGSCSSWWGRPSRASRCLFRRTLFPSFPDLWDTLTRWPSSS